MTVMASCKNPGVKLQYRCRNLIKFASLRWWTGPLSEEVFMSCFLSPISPSHILVIFPSDSEWSSAMCARSEVVFLVDMIFAYMQARI